MSRPLSQTKTKPSDAFLSRWCGGPLNQLDPVAGGIDCDADDQAGSQSRCMITIGTPEVALV
jgi:hypothetical protein